MRSTRGYFTNPLPLLLRFREADLELMGLSLFVLAMYGFLHLLDIVLFDLMCLYRTTTIRVPSQAHRKSGQCLHLRSKADRCSLLDGLLSEVRSYRARSRRVTMRVHRAGT